MSCTVRTRAEPGRPTATPAESVDADRLRVAMGQFATGVTVITTRDRSGRPFGSTANAVSSVSLRPPLVLACLRRESETLSALLERREFAINVLHGSQSGLSDHFAGRTTVGTWSSVAHRSVAEIPLLDGAIATLRCELHDVADGGDHTVVVGHVIALDHSSADDDPLLFYAGSYHRIGDSLAISEPRKPTEIVLPSRDGPLRMLSLSEDEEDTSVAVLTGDPRGRRGVLVYPHVPCLLGDALGSTRCASRGRLQNMQDRMRIEGAGVTVYHRDAGVGLNDCGCAQGDLTPPRLSDDALNALAHAVRILELDAVRLVCSPSDQRRAVRAGVPVAESIDPVSLIQAG